MRSTFMLNDTITIHISKTLMNSLRNSIPSANSLRAISTKKNSNSTKLMFMNISESVLLSPMLSAIESSVNMTMHNKMTMKYIKYDTFGFSRKSFTFCLALFRSDTFSPSLKIRSSSHSGSSATSSLPNLLIKTHQITGWIKNALAWSIAKAMEKEIITA